MKTIDNYISESKHMINIRNGETGCYYFLDGKILKKYTIPKNFHKQPREKEESIALIINRKAEKGVNTARYLDIKRVEEKESLVCYVLGEQPKGIRYLEYTEEKSIYKKLIIQEKFLNIPTKQLEKCIKDLCELFNLGLEIVPNNIYYDEKIGFSFINLNDDNYKDFDYNSLEDILKLNSYISCIFKYLQISYFDSCSIDERNKSIDLYNKSIQRVFLMLEKVIPNFDKYRRNVLRSYEKDVLKSFYDNGIISEDLTLNEFECEEFNKRINKIIETAINNIAIGKYDFWQTDTNEIKNSLDKSGLYADWRYHKYNKIKNDFDCFSEDDLRNKVLDLFYGQLEIIAKDSKNQNILKAKEELDEKKGILKK